MRGNADSRGSDDVDTHPIARPPGWKQPGRTNSTDSQLPRLEPVDEGVGGDRRVSTNRHSRVPVSARRKKRGSVWRELPVLAVVAIVLTFLIQTFIGRPFEIPSGSMERTLHGCAGCTNDRVAADKITYRLSDPVPGDVVIFRGPPAWTENEDGLEVQRSSNPFVRVLQGGLSLIGLAAPDETDFVKRVIAVGGQTVACCDSRNRLVVDGRPLDEPYLYFQPGKGPPRQEAFAPVRLGAGQLWVMGDNRNNSADARDHGPIGIEDVVARARFVMYPVTRWQWVR